VSLHYGIETAFDEMTNISDQAITGNMWYYKSVECVFSNKPGELNNVLKTPCDVIITLDTIVIQKVLTVDYGSRTCDNTFTVTVNGYTFTIN
jgi:hypothetical protein